MFINFVSTKREREKESQSRFFSFSRERICTLQREIKNFIRKHLTMINKFVPCTTAAAFPTENSPLAAAQFSKIIANSYFQIKLMLKNKLKKRKKGG